MVDKDVRLVVRGKDQGGSKVVQAVTQAIDELKSAQSELGKSASSTDSLIGQLGQEFRKLNAEVNRLAAVSKITAELDKAASSIGRLEKETADTAGDFAKMARDAKAATDAVARLRGETESLTAVYQQQKTATAAARADALKGAREMERSQRALNKVLSIQPTKANQRLLGSAATLFAGEVEKAKAASQRAADAHSRLQAEQDQTKASLVDLSAKLRAAVTNESRLVSQTEKLASATRQHKAALAESRNELEALKTSAQQAGAVIERTADRERELAAAAKLAADNLQRTEQTLKAMSRFSTGGGTFTDPKAAASMRRQREELERSRDTWKTLEAEVRRLAVAQQQGAAQTEQQAAAFRQVVGAAKAAKAEFLAQQAALAQLQGSARSSFAEFAKGHLPLQQIKRDIKEVGEAAQQSGQRFAGFRSLFQSFYGDSRKAMSLLQRVRGELLSFAAANVGLYAGITQVANVVKAYQSIEAAQSRLGVVFNQNQTVIRTEMTWLERQAARLGISFQILSDEYSKFAVATQAANFSASATRNIFLSVAEAGRVNKLSLDQMSGVFLALTQMISKGKVSAEELRRQLGDRLAGAFNIFADAIGVSTAELDEMMRKGEVIADQKNMLAFADELTKRFGPQLADSLRTTTTLIGRWENSVYQAQLRVGRGGFIDGLNEALLSLNEFFDSREGRDFFLSVGSALGRFVSGLAQVPKYFDQIVFAVKALIILRVAQWAAGVVAQMTAVSAAARANAASMVMANGALLTYEQAKLRLNALLAATVARLGAFRASVVAAAGGMSVASIRTAAWAASMGALRGVLVGVTAVARGLWMAVGGPIGIIVGLLTFVATDLLGQWAGGVDDTTKALDEHQRIMGLVLSAYDKAVDKSGKWAKNVDGLTLDQANVHLRKMRDEFGKLRGEVERFSSLDIDLVLSGAGFTEVSREMVKAREAFVRGEIDAEAFVKKLEELYSATDNDALRKFIEQFLELARKTKIAETSMREAEIIAAELGSTIADTTGTIASLTDAVDESASSFDIATAKLLEYSTAVGTLIEKIPDLDDAMKQAAELAEIEAAYQTAVGSARTIGQVNEAYSLREQARLAVLMGDVSKDIQSSVKLLVDREGFRPTPYADNDGRLRIGYGSDTITNADGSWQKVVAGMAVSQADAMRDLVRRIGEFQGVVIRQIGADRFDAFNSDQQAVLSSLAYNYGSLPERIIDAVKTGSAEEIAAAIRGLAGDNGGINRERRNIEADMFMKDGESVRMDNFEREEKVTEELKKQAELTKQAIADAQFQLEQAKLEEAGLGRKAAIEEALRDARAQNPAITADQLAAIEEAVGKTYDLAHATDAVKKAEEEINALYELRTQLLELIAYYQSTGQAEKALALREQLAGVNAELVRSIPLVIEMARKLGGPEMDAMIAKMELLGRKVQDVGNKTFVTGEQINNMLASGLVGAVEKVANAWAKGENAIDAMKNAFLEFAGQFLLEIGKMILQQAILNALQQGGGPNGGIGGGIASFITGLFHDGGVVGQGGGSRLANASWFQNAVRYHSGGIAGLRPNEVPAILERNEEILTENDPRHIFNGGGAGGPQMLAKIVNMIDAGDFVSEGLASRAGERAFINFVRANSRTIKTALGA